MKEISLDTKGTTELIIALAKGDVAAFRGELFLLFWIDRRYVELFPALPRFRSKLLIFLNERE